MGFDLYGATQAATELLSVDGVNQSLLPMNASKSIWNTQIQGVYSLIFPFLHIDFGLRIETDLAIKMAFLAHHSSNGHSGIGSTPGATVLQPIPFSPREKTFSTGFTPAKSSDPIKQAASSMEMINTQILYKADSPVVSYGV